MKVLGHYVIVEETQEEIQKTNGGLLLAQSQRDDLRYRKGKVIHPGASTEAVKEGDNIMFDGGAGYIMPYPLDKYKVIREVDIVVVE